MVGDEINEESLSKLFWTDDYGILITHVNLLKIFCVRKKETYQLKN